MTRIPPASPAEPSSRSRYPGTRPFTDSPDDRARFFGRTEEAEQLYLRVLSVPLFVQFGKSGLGKTSLLQAGLFPRLRQKPFLPVMVRLNVSTDALTLAVARSLEQAAQAEGLDFTRGSTDGLWELLSTTTVWRDDLLLTPVLVFDQFEEVFTLHEATFRADLAAELGALASGVPPPRLHVNRSGVSDEWATPPNVKIVVSLREDYLGALQEFTAAVPNLFHERLRLEPLTDEAARQAFTGPAQLTAGVDEEPYWAPPFAFEPRALDSMIEYLKGKSGVIEPFQLQLLCRHAEAIAHAKGSRQQGTVKLTPADFTGNEGFDSVLKHFYRNTLLKLGRSQRKKAEKLCEADLLDGSGHRLMLEEGQILGAGITKDTLARLSEERLLRRERRLESVFYEISHDRLAESIFSSRKVRLPKTVRRAVWTAAVGAPLLLAVVVGWAFVLDNARKRAERSVGFLLGERFLGEVRDLGRGTMLEQVERHVGTGDQWAPLNHGLALRNRGDIKRMQGFLAQSVALFEEALEVLEGIHDDPESPREAARTHERLGEALVDRGDVTRALSHYGAAADVWREVATKPRGLAQAIEDCTSLADGLVSMAALKTRTGETREALRRLEEALEIASTVFFGRQGSLHGCGPLADRPEPYPNARALEVFSRAAMARADILNYQEDYEGAAGLALKASWLRPPSISARRNSLTGLTYRGNARLWHRSEAALDDYRTVLAEFEDLRRWDPDNRIWQRERAATQLLLSEGMVFCHERKAKDCKPMPWLQQAEAVTREAIATLSELAQIDPSNLSLQRDLGWAWLDQASVLAAHGRHAERLAAVGESERHYRSSQLDDADAEGVARLARVLMDKSDALTALERRREAEEPLQRAIELLRGLMAAHPYTPTYVVQLSMARQHEGKALRKAGQTRAAFAADQEAARLLEKYEGLTRNDHQDSHAPRVAEGARLFAQGNYAAALREFMAAESSAREGICHRPAHFAGYGELRNIYDWIELTHDKLGNTGARVGPLSASMHAAQLAAWLAPRESQTEVTHSVQLARNKLGRFYYDNGRFTEALPMVEEEVVAAAVLAQGAGQNAAYVRSLGNAKCGLGVVRKQLDKAGWEQVIRSGLLDLQKAAEIDAQKPDHAKELGSWRRYLADQLEEIEGRKADARWEYELALKAYQEAARRAPRDEEAKTAIRELVERGIRSTMTLTAAP